MIGYKLGKKLAKIDHRTLKLENYIKALPPPPNSMGYVKEVKIWPMMLNDQLGDCVIAAAGHMIEQWSTYAGKAFTPSDLAIIKAYEDVGGYVPGDPSTDNGAYLLDVLNYWRKTGIADHKIVAFVSVNPRNHQEIKTAISLFGSIYQGVGLPLSAQNEMTGGNGLPLWQVPKAGPIGLGTPWSWGGHSVPAVGYNDLGMEVVSWGQVFDQTWNFCDAYCDEAYAAVSQDWIRANGRSPSGLDIDTLLTDLQHI